MQIVAESGAKPGIAGTATLTAPRELSALLSELIAEAREALKSDPYAAGRCFDRLESLLSPTRSTSGRNDDTAVCTGGLARWQTVLVKRHIDANLSERLSTADLAGLVCLSEKHFARAFKKSLGFPPHAYVVGRRIVLAKDLILGTQTPLSQIAFACGLVDQAHLCRLFRRFVGESPSIWRRQHGGRAAAVS
jgi:AraC family transcriptional regulator